MTERRLKSVVGTFVGEKIASEMDVAKLRENGYQIIQGWILSV